MGGDRLKLYPGRKGRLGVGERSDGCDFGWGKFLSFMLLQEGEQSPQCLCREKNAGSSSSCSMLELLACKNRKRSGLFDDKVLSRNEGLGRH